MRSSLFLILTLCSVMLAGQGSAGTISHYRTWTATSGHALDAQYLGTFEGVVWLLNQEQKVVHVPEAQLSESDHYIITSVGARKSLKAAGYRHVPLGFLSNDEATISLVETLVKNKIHRFSVQNMGVEKVIQHLNALYGRQYGGELDIRWGEVDRDAPVTITLRQFSMLNCLNYIARQVGQEIRIEGGQVVIVPKPQSPTQ